MVKIREAQEKDLKQIAELAVICFPNDFVGDGGNPAETKKKALGWVEGRFGNRTFARYHVAESGGRVIGYVFHLMVGGISGVVQLEQIAAAPEERGKGIGSKLILESEKFWKSYFLDCFKKPLHKMLLTTSETNDNAHNLYAKCGFRYETTIKNLYWGNDEEIWVKEIK